MEDVRVKLTYDRGEHLALAFAIDEQLSDQYGERLNLLGYTVAFLQDQGYSSQTATLLLSCWVNSGVHACYAEAVKQPPEAFFPLHCRDIEYQGVAARKVPESEALL